ncbi:lipase/esterase [Weissella oryzae SG25]|uniref:Lipase/esterase n=1 Tax=Weissella oryzae (strain DSM 25784 / JCM 18191 / LMG 30913 / SG25) TaxID=1329250 RepID=A0A069CRU5_WEIOS|nr:alpha/beta hydrolase [Weissella oryzae]GAK30102.1 lipase/esterase [Weissella oryzae SG25]
MEKFIERTLDFIPAQTAWIKKQWLDVPYMAADAKYPQRHTLDIYLPNEGVGPFPTIIDVFGGGLYFGNKSSHKLEPALKLLAKGYAVVSPNYSLIWQASFPQQILELKAVIRWVKAHAHEYQLAENRLALMGESSGAHLALLTAVTADSDNFSNREFGLNPQLSEKVQAVIVLYGPYEFDKFQAQFKSSGVTPKYQETGQATSFEGQLFGGKAPASRPELVAAYNPVSYFSHKMPPILAFVGKADPVVPYQQTVNMMKSAQQFLDPKRAKIITHANGVHGPHDYMTPEDTEIKAEFLQRWL